MRDLGEICAAFERGIDDGTVLVTSVRTEGSTYRRAGARLLVAGDGRTIGAISGGCLEADLVERSREVLLTGTPAVVTYDTTAASDIVWGLGLGCNGVVDLLLEPAASACAASRMARVAACLRTRRATTLATVVRVEGIVGASVGAWVMAPDEAGGDIRSYGIEDRSTEDALVERARAAAGTDRAVSLDCAVDGGRIEVCLEPIVPPRSLVLFGAGHDAVPVARFAAELGWHVVVVDTRCRPATRERFPMADEVVLARPGEAAERVRVDARTAVLLISHAYLDDLETLRWLVGSSADYIGLLGPKRRAERLFADLLTDGIVATRAWADRIYAPVGIDLGAETPEEIALAIVAEIQAVGAGRDVGHLRDRMGPIHERAPAAVRELDVRRVVRTADALSCAS